MCLPMVEILFLLLFLKNDESSNVRDAIDFIVFKITMSLLIFDMLYFL